jgi:Icc-related predicted phosphoesterase
MNKLTIILGDTHGEWKTVFYNIKQKDISNATIIHVGDVGVGFKKSEKEELEVLMRVNEFLAERNIEMLAIRGNHDNPDYFNGSYRFSNLKLLADYTTLTLNDEQFMFVGGAISIDRHMRTDGLDYWSSEKFQFNEDRIKGQKCDVLVTHTAPKWLGLNSKGPIQWHLNQDKNLWEELEQERQDMNYLYNRMQPKKFYCGHFHMRMEIMNEYTQARILNIHEMIEHFPCKK